MDAYIRREDAIKCIEGQCVDGKMWGNDESEGTLIEAYSAIDDLMDIPAADVALVRHGRWEWREKWDTSDTNHYVSLEYCGWYCSHCGIELGEYLTTKTGETLYLDDDFREPLLDFCPNCGAKMDGGNDNG